METPVSAALPPPSKTIALDPELVVGEIKYSELLLREPTAGEMEAVDHLVGVPWTVALVSSVSSVPVKAIRQLKISTLNEASAYLTGFIGAAR